MPVIADFLGVTIDELFGLAPEKVMSVHERAMIEIYDMSKDNKTQRKRLEYAYELVRASVMGCCGCNLFGNIPDNVRASEYGFFSNSSAYLTPCVLCIFLQEEVQLFSLRLKRLCTSFLFPVIIPRKL